MPRSQTLSDVHRKKAAELELHLKVARFHRTVVKAFRSFYSRNASIIDLGRSIDLQEMYFRHYNKVGRIFKDDIRVKLPRDVAMNGFEAMQVNRTLRFQFRVQAAEQARRTMNTTRKNMEMAVFRARRDNPGLNYQQLALVAANNLERVLVGRGHTISIFETQWAAEYSKSIESAVLVGDTMFELKAAETRKFKIWDSMGDSRVRTGTFNHLRADGQSRLPDGAFNVSGERLLFPGDMSLGASLGNVMRCRCSAYYDDIAISKIRRGKVGKDDIGSIVPPGAERFGTGTASTSGFSLRPSLEEAIARNARSIAAIPQSAVGPELIKISNRISKVDAKLSRAILAKDLKGMEALEIQLSRLKSRQAALATRNIFMASPQNLSAAITGDAAIEAAVIQSFRAMERLAIKADKAIKAGNLEIADKALKKAAVAQRRINKRIENHSQDSFIVDGVEFKKGLQPVDRRDLKPAPVKKLKPKPVAVPKPTPKPKQTGSNPDDLIHSDLDDIHTMPDLAEVNRQIDIEGDKLSQRMKAGTIGFDELIKEQAVFERRRAELGSRAAQRFMHQKKILPANGKTWKFNHFERNLNTAMKTARVEMAADGIDLERLRTKIAFSSGSEQVAIDVELELFRRSIIKRNKLNDVAPKKLAINASHAGSKYTADIETVLVKQFPPGLIPGSIHSPQLDRVTFRMIPDGVDERAHASSFANSIHLKTSDVKDAGTIVHEFGHHLEFRSEDNQDRIASFYKKRTRKQSATQIYPDNSPNEYGIEDGFYDHYVGKTYGGKGPRTPAKKFLKGTTEVLSMGIQGLADPRAFKKMIEKDPEHLELIYSILRGN